MVSPIRSALNKTNHDILAELLQRDSTAEIVRKALNGLIGPEIDLPGLDEAEVRRQQLICGTWRESTGPAPGAKQQAHIVALSSA
jgi:hypothetical protein